ncbi:MAG: DNA-directed RNA polymerase subunit beta' [Armatimonadota bacterium]|nr:MAG: DNA-directed RNA polymerase subunit beta' [Armatimonadota bacterium]
MTDARTFDKIRIGIASPDEIRSWSCGEVKKPETINYRSFKPERDGLFCEKIFGPVKDWECHCGRYKKVKFKGIVCDRCGVEVTRSKVRRERMGHIELATPVCHIWYLKGVPSPLSLILDIPPRNLEKVLYFASYIVTKADRERLNELMDDIRRVAAMEIEHIQEQRDENIARIRKEGVRQIREGGEEGEALSEEDAEGVQRDVESRIREEEEDAEERIEDINAALRLIESVQKFELITDDQYRQIEHLLEVVSERLDRDVTGVFEAGMGGAAIRQLLAEVDLEALQRQLRTEIAQTQGPKRARAIKRLEIVDAFIESRSRPEWMILECIPVISPELRPMVQLDGGRFATSDLNDLYRRIINRNNRLKKITEIRAPESIVNHEKRLLQEAVDALIDNGRRARPVVGSNNRPLKSLSDMLKGKEGRFRKNLLGKRVDYSGRSVIVVGPHLKLHQCGLPKEMALELFKPFVMKTLVERGFTTNIKTAKRMIDRMKPEVWDALEEVIHEHPVLLNRAPTLHRLGIQAFEPVLVDGKAIQIHPLVCHAYNADFDGDQMAVHVPLSWTAQAEARVLMLSTSNLFSPADGRPIVAPVQDIVLGAYYLTQMAPGEPGEFVYSSPQEALLAHDNGVLRLQEPIRVRIADPATGEKRIEVTTPGRLILNGILPESLRWVNDLLDKKKLAQLVNRCYEAEGRMRTIQLLDELKSLGFLYATKGGITISMTDMDIPAKRDEIIRRTEEAVIKQNRYYEMGRITQSERRSNVQELWMKAADEVADAILEHISHDNPIHIITDSGARGSTKQITQLAGMRGLMSDPFGNLIEDLPIKSNFHEGLSVLEYFISTHGARKGLADTALRTADAGYLTRRLVDVAQDVIIRGHDCGTTQGVKVAAIEESGEVIETLKERIRGRTALEDILLPGESEPVVRAGEIITNEQAARIEESGITEVWIRSPLMCEQRQGVCSRCYGLDLATGTEVEIGTAVGIIAAQSIGEPGTQLTMRTFHTGGVAGKYLTGVAEVKKKKQESLRELHEDMRQGIISFDEGEHHAERERTRAIQQVLKVLEDQVRGLLRVVELFEARKPKGQAIITEVGGRVADIETTGLKKVVIHSPHPVSEPIGSGEVLAEDVVDPDTGEVLASKGSEVNEKLLRKLRETSVKEVMLRKTHLVPYRGNLEVEIGDIVQPGDRLTEGPLDPQKVLQLQGVRGVMDYLVREIQSVYKSQGVDINDKHVEVIVRQMLRKRKVVEPGDTTFLPGQVVDKFVFEDENRRVLSQDPPGTPATAEWVLLGITEASLATESFLSAASFQKTTRVLTDAAVRGKVDNLVGLKENVIIGRLIPAGTGLPMYRDLVVTDGNGVLLAPITSRAQQASRQQEDFAEILPVDRARDVLAEPEPEPEPEMEEDVEEAVDLALESIDLEDLDEEAVDAEIEADFDPTSEEAEI